MNKVEVSYSWVSEPDPMIRRSHAMSLACGQDEYVREKINEVLRQLSISAAQQLSIHPSKDSIHCALHTISCTIQG